jgi:metal-responsive CopG/Arc/MetJ family transcriptional regulator
MSLAKLQYLDYSNDSQEHENMSDGRNRVVLPVSLSEAQLETIDTAAKEAGKNRSEYVRWVFAQVIQDFPDDLAGHGKHIRTPKN